MDSLLSEKIDKASYRIHNRRINLRYAAKPNGPGSGKCPAPSTADVSIVGFDDAPECAYYTPPLTTIKQDYDALGTEIIHYLVELINNPSASIHQRVLMPQLIVRESTRRFGLT